MTSLYEHAGREQALHRLEEAFYTKVLADPLLRRVFTSRQPHHVEHLTWFTAESFGGPDRFSRELGFEHLIAVHRHLEISDEAGLPDDEDFRNAVRAHVEFGSRVAQQNSHAETDAELNPLRQVPRWTWPGDDRDD